LNARAGNIDFAADAIEAAVRKLGNLHVLVYRADGHESFAIGWMGDGLNVTETTMAVVSCGCNNQGPRIQSAPTYLLKNFGRGLARCYALPERHRNYVALIFDGPVDPVQNTSVTPFAVVAKDLADKQVNIRGYSIARQNSGGA